jgi:hypothetical protein
MSQHPTILIGYGAYGLRVMHQFLAGAAARGALAWDREAEVGALKERQLHSLSLLWMPDGFRFEDQKVPEDLLDQSGYELMEDLYSQIIDVTGSNDEIKRKLPGLVEREKNRLLNARRRSEPLVSGIDIIVLAQPSREEIVGWLRDLLEPVMARMAEDPALFDVRQSSSDARLNFMEILDFQDYWSPEMAEVRQALQLAIRAHDEGLASGRPTLGRVYLFDGNTAGGKRTPESRIDEVVLLLELLLLESLRENPNTRNLYRREQLKIPAVATIGVRVVERSSGLLRRLAAAGFAHGWLAHLISASSGAAPAGVFSNLVNPFRGERLAATVGENALRAAAAQELTKLTNALLDISPAEADWGARLQKEAERLTESVVLRLSRLSGEQSVNLTEGSLKTLQDELEAAITASIKDPIQPMTLGGLIDHLGAIEEEFGEAIAQAGTPPPADFLSGKVFREADRMQREYQMFVSRQVQTARLASRWWPRAAILFAVAVTPFFLRGAADLGLESSVFPDWAQVAVSVVLSGGLFWWFGRKPMQALLERIIERARAFYTDPDRGRLAERVRASVASPLVAGRIETHALLLSFGLRQYAAGLVAAEFQRARSMLVKRRNEVEWLRRQVSEFLLSYQVDPTPLIPEFQPGRVTSDVRCSLETNDDLAAVAQTLPRTPDRFRQMAASLQVFDFWAQTFCDTFLHPVAFLDALSDRFQDKLELDEQELRRRAGEIASFLGKLKIPVCFHWLAAGGLPPAESGALFPAAWRTLPGLSHALAAAGFGDRVSDTPNTERLYLYNARLGVPCELLERAN